MENEMILGASYLGSQIVNASFNTQVETVLMIIACLTDPQMLCIDHAMRYVGPDQDTSKGHSVSLARWQNAGQADAASNNQYLRDCERQRRRQLRPPDSEHIDPRVLLTGLQLISQGRNTLCTIMEIYNPA